MGGGGFAGGFSFAITDNFVFDAGYSAAEGPGVAGTAFSNNPNTGGIFGAGSQSYIAQLSYLSDGVFDGALVYANGMTGAGATAKLTPMLPWSASTSAASSSAATMPSMM
jgi:hypothetical protein